jgi:protocatechuate 3,4-dioxygenase beta subunit
VTNEHHPAPQHPASDHHDATDDHDRGLAFDLGTLFSRRRLLTLLAGTGAAAFVVACGGGSDSAASTVSTASSATGPATTAAASNASAAVIPEETAGPYPGDGSNGVNVLDDSGIVRSDIRSSFGSSATTAAGVPLTITFQVTDASAAGAPLADAAVYVWHCDREGRYSMYSDGVTGENYLRGVQPTGADGTVTFTSIFPAAYSGRWPHVHFEVYSSVDDATAGGSPIATSQIALPEDTCELVYATSGYEQSVRNMQSLSLQTDNVFSDGWEQQLGTVTGDVSSGLAVSLAVPV